MIRQDSKRAVAQDHLAHLSRVRRLRSSAKALEPQLVQRQALCHQSVVCEYGAELLQHMQRLEAASASASAGGVGRAGGEHTSSQSFAAQPQINARMRYLIYDFLMCCHTRLGLSTATLFLSYGILDRYTSRFIVRSGEYQLLALTALWVSSKYWDTKNRTATLPVLLSLCCEQYSAQQFGRMELQLLKDMNWSLSHITTADSIIDISLFLAGSDVDINEVKLGAVMLCELAAFDLPLALDTEWSKIVLAAITLVKSALRFASRGGGGGGAQCYVDYESALRGAPQQLADVCHALLLHAVKRDTMPSSFRFKYLRDPASPSGRILDSLTAYHVQWRLEQLLVAAPAHHHADAPADLLNDRSLHHFALDNSNPSLASCESASPISIGSPFASPGIGTELSTVNATSHTTPDSVQTPSSSERPPVLAAAAVAPLSPITPSIMQSKAKWEGALRRRPCAPGGHARASSAALRMGQLAAVPAHRKRASSDMDIHFFAENLATKR